MSVQVPKDNDLRHFIEEPLPYQRGRKLQWFEKKEAGLRSRVMKHGVVRSRRTPLPKNLLVTGTGRCGTTWLSDTLIAAEFDVPHEYVGDHGTVSMFFQADSNWYPYIPWSPGAQGRVAHVGERRSDFHFQHVVHLVRHPLETVASMKSIITETTRDWFHHNNISPVPFNHRPATERDFYVWLGSVMNCEGQADQTVTLKRAVRYDDWWYEMLERASMQETIMPTLPAKNKSSGFKRHDPITWTELRKLNASLYRAVRKTWDGIQEKEEKRYG